jgi:hypothetical protein
MLAELNRLHTAACTGILVSDFDGKQTKSTIDMYSDDTWFETLYRHCVSQLRLGLFSQSFHEYSLDQKTDRFQQINSITSQVKDSDF